MIGHKRRRSNKRKPTKTPSYITFCLKLVNGRGQRDSNVKWHCVSSPPVHLIKIRAELTFFPYRQSWFPYSLTLDPAETHIDNVLFVFTTFIKKTIFKH
jgi:hypothetical protein